MPGIAGYVYNGLLSVQVLVTFSSLIPFFQPTLVSTVGSMEIQPTNLTTLEANRVFIVHAIPTLAAATATASIVVYAGAVNAGSSIQSNIVGFTYGACVCDSADVALCARRGRRADTRYVCVVALPSTLCWPPPCSTNNEAICRQLNV